MKKHITTLIALLLAALVLGMALWFEGTHQFATAQGFEMIRYPRDFQWGNIEWAMVGRLLLTLFVLLMPWVNGSESRESRRRLYSLFPDMRRGLDILLSLLNVSCVLALGISYGHMALSGDFVYTPRDHQMLGACLTFCTVFWALLGFTASFVIWRRQRR